jgi:glycosyltransferase involved in cell wall biosynthesis
MVQTIETSALAGPECPEISVVMPVYNAARWLNEAITSIGRQSVKRIELIIIDDGSDDSSPALASRAAEQDSRIRVVRRLHRGLSATLNEGIALARAAFIARMDADDISHPYRLERQMAFLASHPEISAVGSWAELIDQDGRPAGSLTPESDPSWLEQFLIRQNPFIHASMFMRAVAVRQVGGYREIVEGAEDYDLWLRLSHQTRLAILPKFLISHRRHGASASARRATTQLLAARLARTSAMCRKNGKPDFLESWKPPLNFTMLETVEELRPAAAAYRLLETDDAAVSPTRFRAFGRAQLNHAERKAAQVWLWRLCRMPASLRVRVHALFWLIRLHPARAVRLILGRRQQA